MRLFLIPISTKRAFVYSQSHKLIKQTSYLDKITAKVAEIWSRWERTDGWKKSLTSYGHRVLQRIPYEEWGLKSIPPLSPQRRAEESGTKRKIDVIFPGNVIKRDKVPGILRHLATERQDLHRRKMWWSILLAPLTAPIALIPLVPNIPFFYLAYRGWSHWRALNGSKHLVFLLDKGLLEPKSSAELELFYSVRLIHVGKRFPSKKGPPVSTEEEMDNAKEKLLLDVPDGKGIGNILNAPELQHEVERAVVQIGQKLDSEPESAKLHYRPDALRKDSPSK